MATRVNMLLLHTVISISTTRPSTTGRLQSIQLKRDVFNQYNLMVVVDVNVVPTRKRRVKRKIYLQNKANVDEIQRCLQDFLAEYDRETADLGVEEKWTKFHKKILQLMDDHVPHKMTSSRYNLPWFDRTLRRQCRRKQRLYNKAKASGRKSD